jgi:RHS repeat-associated protein
VIREPKNRVEGFWRRRQNRARRNRPQLPKLRRVARRVLTKSASVHTDARYYEPNSGRFLSADPMGQAASPSLYDFAGGDPVNFFDPTGRCPKGNGPVIQGMIFNGPNDPRMLVYRGDGQYANGIIYPVGPHGENVADPNPVDVGPGLFDGVGSAAVSALKVKVVGDAGFILGATGDVSQDIGGQNTNVAVGGTVIVGADIMAGFEGTVPLTGSTGPSDGSVGLNVGAGVALGVTAQFTTQSFFGGAIKVSLPTSIQFFLGVGLGLEAHYTPPAPASDIYSTENGPN